MLKIFFVESNYNNNIFEMMGKLNILVMFKTLFRCFFHLALVNFSLKVLNFPMHYSSHIKDGVELSSNKSPI